MHLSDRERNTPKVSGSPSAIVADRGARDLRFVIGKT
jgi:hypothetical protein